MHADEARIMALTSIAHFFTHVFMLVYPTLAVLIAREWGTTEADMLLLATPGFVLYGLAAYPQGLWADRIGGFWPVVVGLLGMGVGALVCGFSASDRGLAVGLGIIGLGASAYHPAGLGLISHGMSRPGWALGVNGAIGSAAVATAPALAELMSLAFGWQGTFLGLGGIALISGAVLSRFPIVVDIGKDASAPGKDDKESLFTGPFLWLCLAMLFSGLAYRGVNTVFPTLFAERVEGLGHGIATSVAYGFAVVMNYFGGRLVDKFEAPTLYFAFHAMSFFPLLLTAWLAGPALLSVAALYAASAMAAQPVENRYIAINSPASRRSVAYGIKFTITFGVGALAVPVVSAILSAHGTQSVMWALSGTVGALVLSAWALLRFVKVAR